MTLHLIFWLTGLPDFLTNGPFDFLVNRTTDFLAYMLSDFLAFWISYLIDILPEFMTNRPADFLISRPSDFLTIDPLNYWPFDYLTWSTLHLNSDKHACRFSDWLAFWISYFTFEEFCENRILWSLVAFKLHSNHSCIIIHYWCANLVYKGWSLW